jgi:serine/threonine protein kinase
MDDVYTQSKAENIPPRIQVGTIRGTRSFQHLDSVRHSANRSKGTHPYQFADSSFEHICSLGSGAYSTISKVLHRPTHTIMAKKVMPIDPMENETQEETETRILRELNILLRCQSPYIVNYYGTYIAEHRISILLEYMDVGSLESIYKKLGLITYVPMKTIALQSLRGLLYLEEQGIVHRGFHD